MSFYRQKYLKYKMKYLAEKHRQQGGSTLLGQQGGSTLLDHRNTSLDEPLITGSSNKYAFVFCVFGEHSKYVLGTIVSCYNLKKIREKSSYQYDIVVIITPDVIESVAKESSTNRNRELLLYFADYVIIAPYINYRSFIPKNLVTIKQHYTKVWFKLHIYRLMSYEKICLLDADYLVNLNYQFPEIFHKNVPLGIFELPAQSINCERLTKKISLLYHGITFELILLYNLLLFETNKCSYHDTCNHRYGGFNASVFTITPSMYDWKILNQVLQNNPDDSRLKFWYPEQQFLTLFYLLGSINKDTFSKMRQDYFNANSDYQILMSRLLTCGDNCNVNIGCSPVNDISDYLPRIEGIAKQMREIYFGVDDDKINDIYRNLKNKEWQIPVLDDKYYITEYYDLEHYNLYINQPEKVLGYPLMQQEKLWDVTVFIVDNDYTGLEKIRSYGAYEWLLTYKKMYEENEEIFKTLDDERIHKISSAIISVANYLENKVPKKLLYEYHDVLS